MRKRDIYTGKKAAYRRILENNEKAVQMLRYDFGLVLQDRIALNIADMEDVLHEYRGLAIAINLMLRAIDEYSELHGTRDISRWIDTAALYVERGEELFWFYKDTLDKKRHLVTVETP